MRRREHEHVPLGSNVAAGVAAGLGKPVNRTYAKHHEWTSQFEGAERIAKYGMSREDADALGLESQFRARTAIDEGRFEAQIVPIAAAVFGEDGARLDTTRTFSHDEVPRETSREALGACAN